MLFADVPKRRERDRLVSLHLLRDAHERIVLAELHRRRLLEEEPLHLGPCLGARRRVDDAIETVERRTFGWRVPPARIASG